ncbi:MAG: DUF1080 domain-containing protein [Planctomycetota bacterium]|nr:DUF1080 domain-containing protein [Planctomycetota bacterium]
MLARARLSGNRRGVTASLRAFAHHQPRVNPVRLALLAGSVALGLSPALPDALASMNTTITNPGEPSPGVVTVGTSDAPSAASPVDKALGWKVLFDGTSTEHWRGFKKESFPEKGWTIEDGCLKINAGGGAGDIVSVEEYSDFELSFEFKVDKGANSGVMYRVSETYDYPWQTGPEFQILDDAGHKDGAMASRSVGALYDMIAPPADKPIKPAGEFNQARIRIKNGVLQHFLNGVKIAECRIDDQSWTDRIAASKFKDMKGFGLEPKGRIALQDHGDNVWYRNIMIRDLSPGANAAEIALFNGKDLTGWNAFVPDLIKEGKNPADVWSVQDGVLVCAGKPVGYIKTDKSFSNFVLRLDWRFNPVTKQEGNSGVLVRIQEPDKIWPKSVEAQLHSKNAGDFWNIDQFSMNVAAERTKGRRTLKTHFAEHEVGQWNDYEIVVNKGDIVLRVNGEEVNRATDAAELAGQIALQSEGAEIHFRNVRVLPLN